MGMIIAVAMQKGGVAKSTSSVNLSAALAEQGRRVLLVDLDPQGNASEMVGLNADALDERNTIYGALSSLDHDNLFDVRRIIQPTEEAFDIIPANLDLAAAELELQSAIRREYALARTLQPIAKQYDFILIDCPPSLSLLVVNALTAAHAVLIPLQAEFLAARALGRLLSLVRRVQRSGLNPHLRVMGAFFTLVDARAHHPKEVAESIRAAYPELFIFEAQIARSIRFADASRMGMSILRSPGAREPAETYRRLAREVLSHA